MKLCVLDFIHGITVAVEDLFLAPWGTPLWTLLIYSKFVVSKYFKV